MKRRYTVINVISNVELNDMFVSTKFVSFCFVFRLICKTLKRRNIKDETQYHTNNKLIF